MSAPTGQEPPDEAIPPVRARRAISENRFLTYVEEDLLDRHGRPYTYYQVESKWDAVVVVPVFADGRLLVERIYRHPYHRYLLEFPAGGIEHDEDPHLAARRELTEETGHHAGRLTTLGSLEVLPGLLRMRLHIVLAEELTGGGAQRLDGMEMLECRTISEAEAWTEAQAQPASSFLVLGLLYLQRHRALAPP